MKAPFRIDHQSAVSWWNSDRIFGARRVVSSTEIFSPPFSGDPLACLTKFSPQTLERMRP